MTGLVGTVAHAQVLRYRAIAEGKEHRSCLLFITSVLDEIEIEFHIYISVTWVDDENMK
jgi:hypothetical protein